MNMTIDIVDETNTINQKQQELVEQLLESAAKSEGLVGEIELSLTFVTDEEIQEINREYRDKDQPTDVISFALNEQGENEQEIIAEGLPNVLGDIIISVPRIGAQAEEYGHSFERELGFLVVHGFLHLLGFDHMTDADEKEMFAKQENILNEYGLTR
ncbi:rRNA maturation factor [Alkalihalobacillus alcalophilus ATCC 27647 = CGMCC 1.3604]|uniref:Endoribonuclease YbeY n=1 Tax=Alkalihalobacillus alcalophilus ATCC 27647 = CGMCC 1.3604 TaxID=1218173 RepID=A0A094XI25_ALKAL|nr:rRNA maturation RNase YbeY [Alkalihalobacillus alcalophilus]KGA98435.1 rRNA maturation factor [Alkalihalobacillus alcalophilus ATCC 27647 = CGMCC 1.3604]MED1563317.1 rRNA maturation RNase YbeY [Alkalihalobacillus alcalophilus]THG88506.1 rRNA maturation factor [Alkalihalobacillus alcalophilus ATCC 27647 = CGMCC 1.3604]